MKLLKLIFVIFAASLVVGCSSVEPAQKQQLELTIDPILLQAVPEMITIQTTNPCSLVPTTELPYKDK